METTEIKLGAQVQIRMNGRVGIVRGIYRAVDSPPAFDVRYADSHHAVHCSWFQADELIPNATAPASMAHG